MQKHVFGNSIQYLDPDCNLHLIGFTENEDKEDEKSRVRREETEKILSQFRSLTTGQQEEQRQTWAEELKLVRGCSHIDGSLSFPVLVLG